MNELQIFGGWEDLGSGQLSISARPYKHTGLFLELAFVVNSANASISARLSLAGFEALALADKLDQLFSQRIDDVVLPCDTPGSLLHFGWRDFSRCIAEMNGELAQELSWNEQRWKIGLQVHHFRFPGHHFRGFAKLFLTMDAAAQVREGLCAKPAPASCDLPVFNGESGHSLELAGIGGDENEACGHGLGRKENIVGADHLALRFE
jgi:hypothetical protein